MIAAQGQAKAEELEVVAIHHTMDTTYHFAAGYHFSCFYERLKRKQVWGIQCPQCSATYVPPRPFCGRCNVKTLTWIQVGPAGTVRAISEVFLPVLDPTTGKNRKVPHTMALVELDRADTLLHHLMLDDSKCRIGSRVELCFVDLPQGSARDFAGFRALANESSGGAVVQAGDAPSSRDDFEHFTLTETLQMPFRYYAGSVGSQFLLGLKEGRLMAMHCQDCKAMNLPPAGFCYTCFGENQEFRDVALSGTLTGIAKLPEEERTHLPGDVYGFAMLQLDGLQTSFLHHLADPNLKKGARGTLVFRNYRHGSILDLRGVVAQ